MILPLDLSRWGLARSSRRGPWQSWHHPWGLGGRKLLSFGAVERGRAVLEVGNVARATCTTSGATLAFRRPGTLATAWPGGSPCRDHAEVASGHADLCGGLPKGAAVKASGNALTVVNAVRSFMHASGKTSVRKCKSQKNIMNPRYAKTGSKSTRGMARPTVSPAAGIPRVPRYQGLIPRRPCSIRASVDKATNAAAERSSRVGHLRPSLFCGS